MKTKQLSKGLTLILLLLSGIVNGQIMYEWQHTYDHGNTDRALDVRNQGSTYIHVAGVREGAGGMRIVTQKYNTAGNLIWTKTGNNYLTGDLLFLERDGSFNTFVVTVNAAIGGFSITKYNSNATQVWRKNFTEVPVGL